MKIALIGIRGVSANYDGFETCVEEVENFRMQCLQFYLTRKYNKNDKKGNKSGK
jgi:hypothetical protein